jgi:hypothetical protein
LQLESPSLGELSSRVMASYGPQATIIAVDEVTVGGIGGFFATRRFVATVEVPDPPLDTRPIDSHELDLPARVGIAALLDDADAAEVHVNGTETRTSLSTSSREFADILGELAAVTDAPVAAPAAAVPSTPLPLGNAGDLVIVAGLDGDALPVTRMMARSAAISVAGGLVIPDATRVEDRQAAVAARATGVRAGRPVFIAVGLGHGTVSVREHAGMLEALRADQVWAVVDAGRKPADTAAWVRELDAVVRVDAVAAMRRRSTDTPESVESLNLPVSWAFDAWIG